MEGFWREIRVALRSLLRTPGYTTAVICILAIAIGVTTALFSIVHGVLLKPLPYRDPERLVLIDEASEALDRLSVSYPDFLDWRDRSKSFEALGAWKDETFNLSGLDRPERVKAWMFSAGLLRLLGVTPALGREFTPEEDRPGGMPVALVTNPFWRTHLGWGCSSSRQDALTRWQASCGRRRAAQAISLPWAIGGRRRGATRPAGAGAERAWRGARDHRDRTPRARCHIGPGAPGDGGHRTRHSSGARGQWVGSADGAANARRPRP